MRSQIVFTLMSPSSSVRERQDTGVRPGRSDIAVPEFPPRIRWLGGEPRPMAELAAAGPALVHFFDFAQLNSVRSLPYLAEWQRRYEAAGLAVLGVQAPRFPFGANPEIVAAGLHRLGVGFPVAIDAGRELWLDYGCKGWPSLFLWGRGGALRWYHFGEGEYQATEEAVQQQLREADAMRELPQPMPPLRPSDALDARVMPPTPEHFPAGEGEAWEPREGDGALALEYEGGGAYATLEGSGQMALEIDGFARPPVIVDGAGLYELAVHPRHETHSLRLRPMPGLRVWSVSFAPGVP
jgi:hypothetical protein